MTKIHQPGRAWATIGFLAGIVASVAANVAHAYVPPDHAAGDWAPASGAIVAAAVWPIALLLAIETVERAAWSRPMYRWIGTLGLLAVAGIALTISYLHMSGLLRAYGEDDLSATIGPLAIDGLMLTCSVALLSLTEARTTKIRATEAATRRPTEAPQPIEDSALTGPAEVAGDVAGIPAMISATSGATDDPGEGNGKALEPAERIARWVKRNPNIKPGEIADRTGIPISTVRYHMRRAKQATPAGGVPASDQPAGLVRA